MLWDAAELTQQQSWDWDAYYDQTGIGRTGAFVGKPMPKFLERPAGGWTMYDHGVNNGMGTKSCATWCVIVTTATTTIRPPSLRPPPPPPQPPPQTPQTPPTLSPHLYFHFNH